MKEIPLTLGYKALVDDQDFERVNAFRWIASIERRKDGSIRNVYARRFCMVNGRKSIVTLHRFILGITDPVIEVDHRDHDGCNCQRTNLRVATKPENQCNARKRQGTTSRFKGVSWHRAAGKWHARIGRPQKHLGLFDSEEDAARAYDDAAKVMFGEFATLNFA